MEVETRSSTVFSHEDAARLQTALQSHSKSKSKSRSLSSSDVTILLHLLASPPPSTNSSTSAITSTNNTRNDIKIFVELALSALQYALRTGGGGHDYVNNDYVDNDKEKKRILLGLLPLAHLNLSASVSNEEEEDESSTISESSMFIRKALELIIATITITIESSKESNQSNNDLNMSGVELLLPAYITNARREDAMYILQLLCESQSQSNDSSNDASNEISTTTTRLNPLAAAALTSALREMHSLSPHLLGLQLHNNNNNVPVSVVSSLIIILLHCLDELKKRGEYECIPPLIYQLCGLATIDTTSTNTGGGSGGASPFIKKHNDNGLTILHGIGDFLQTLFEQDVDNDVDKRKWAISTSLRHISHTMRHHPSLPATLLHILRGKHVNTNTNTYVHSHPLRYRRVHTMILAMGLSMAYTIPRLNDTVLGIVRDMMMEEMILKYKRQGQDGGQDVDGDGGQGRWMDVCTRVMTMTSGDESNEDEDFDSGEGWMWHCIHSLLQLIHNNSNKNAGGSGSSSSSGRMAIEADFSALHSTFISLGCTCMDVVKKDKIQSKTSSSTNQLPPMPTCVSSVASMSMTCIKEKAMRSTAALGRRILVHLFCGAGNDNGDEEDDGGGGGGAPPPQCRIILTTTLDKLCSMAPNAMEYSYLLSDIVNNESSSGSGRGAIILKENFLPMLIDLLAHVPNGGLNPTVASQILIPTLHTLLNMSLGVGRGQRRLRGRRARKEINAHMDHVFLLTKKTMFCTDVERRCVAVRLLVMLLATGLQLQLQLQSQGNKGASGSRGGQEQDEGLLEEVKGYLRRCMTQHQCEVRLEVYASFVALLPNNSASKDRPQDDVNDGDAVAVTTPPTFSITLTIEFILMHHLERYIAVEEEENVMHARRQRAIAHGTHLSQMEIDDDVNDEEEEDQEHAKRSDSDSNSDRPPPLRLDICASSIRSSSALRKNNHQGGGSGLGLGLKVKTQSSKKRGRNNNKMDILSESIQRISEPMAFLIATAEAVLRSRNKTMRRSINPNTTSSQNHASQMPSPLAETLYRLQKNVSNSTMEQYLKWCYDDCKSSSSSFAVKALSTCLLVISITEVLMALPHQTQNPSEGESNNTRALQWEILGKLFRLREMALRKGACVLANVKAAKTKKQTKKQKVVDVEEGAEEEETQSQGANDGDGNDGGDTNVDFDYESYANRPALEKFKRNLEEAASASSSCLGPSLPAVFLARSLRECSILADRDDVLGEDDDDESNERNSSNKVHVPSELGKNPEFLRFLLHKSMEHLSGGSPLLKMGYKFDECNNHHSNNADSIRVTGMAYLASSFALGPLLLAKFLSLVQKRKYTSLRESETLSSSCGQPLTQLVMEGYIACVRRMTSFVPGHALSRNQRLKAFLQTSMVSCFAAFPSLKEKCDACKVSIPSDFLAALFEVERDLVRLIYPFIKPMSVVQGSDADVDADGASSPATYTGGLLAELIIQGLDMEATMCCNLIKCIGKSLSGPCRQFISINMLECFRVPKTEAGTNKEGLLGLKYDTDIDCHTCASAVMDASILLDGLIDGCTSLSVYSDIISKDKDFDCRTKCDFTTITPGALQQLAKRPYRPSEFHALDKDKLIGMAYLLSSSIVSSVGVNSNFEEESDGDSNAFEFKCTKVLAAQDTACKEYTSTVASILASIEYGLADVEYVSNKLLPHLVPQQRQTVLVQRMVMCRLYAVGKVLCSLAPLMDNSGNFACAMLKSCRRIYTIYTKLAATLSSHPAALRTPENQVFLQLLGSKLNRRTAALLLTIEEATGGVGKKQLANGKISSQGRIAAQLVFEMERCDNAILKLSEKLKANGHVEEGELLQGLMVVSQIRGFRIKKGEMKAALERSQEESSSLVKKQRVKKEKSKKKISKKSKIEPESNDGNASNGSSSQESHGEEGSDAETEDEDE